LEELQQKDHTSPELTKRYVELMKKFKPVMRHYFTEKHREPMAWFSMRLNYTRSVAVTSIVGHILGIGDRHCSNILIDKLTGELVHIDFGIVFEDVSVSV
jgi:ataxia telangiectasia mutated family protein